MENLPDLIKIPGRTYSVGAEIDIKGGKALFTFCVLSNVGVEMCETVANDFMGYSKSPAPLYLRQLSDFYNCKILIEIPK